MKNVVIAALVILLLVQCSQDKREVAPGVAKLVGTWQLIEPDSPFDVTLLLELDTANPPNDVTHFKVNGKSAINLYHGFLSAAVDGMMVFTGVGSTRMGGAPEAMSAEQTYFNKLKTVVRYELPNDNLLRLYHGGEIPGALVYKKIK
jgi:hypothetical protein